MSAKKNASSPPILSVITRSCGRDKLLKRNRDSLKHQSDLDYEQIILTDEKKRGYFWANAQIAKLPADSENQINGAYVYILDDDDYVIDVDLIKSLKSLNNLFPRAPEVIICKGYINDQIFPKIWNKRPVRGSIGSPNFIVTRQLFFENAHLWEQDRGGDFSFINGCWNIHASFLWWNKIVFIAG
jgi:hypothetical protein